MNKLAQTSFSVNIVLCKSSHSFDFDWKFFLSWSFDHSFFSLILKFKDNLELGVKNHKNSFILCSPKKLKSKKDVLMPNGTYNGIMLHVIIKMRLSVERKKSYKSSTHPSIFFSFCKIKRRKKAKNTKNKLKTRRLV